MLASLSMLVSLSMRTHHLMETPLFKSHGNQIPKERTKLIYDRAREIAIVYSFGIEDVTNLTETFWALTADHMSAVDASIIILLSIQINLAAGTLAPFVEHRPELRPLLDRMLKFDISCAVH